MKQEQLEKTQIGEIRHLLSHLHGEVTGLEASYHRLLLVLEKFEGVSATDSVTGLINHRTFEAKFKEVGSKCRAEKRNFGVLTVEIDDELEFREVHGQATFDEVQRKIAQLLKRYESPRCRIGKMETEGGFTVSFIGSDAEMVGAAEMIRRFVERMHGPTIDPSGKKSEQVSWKCTVSVGIASSSKSSVSPNGSNDATVLIRSAEEALDRAKEKGGNQVAV